MHSVYVTLQKQTKDNYHDFICSDIELGALLFSDSEGSSVKTGFCDTLCVHSLPFSPEAHFCPFVSSKWLDHRLVVFIERVRSTTCMIRETDGGLLF